MEKEITKPNAEELALEKFAQMMIQKIETISSDWHKPWFTKGAAQWATNLSGREYNGMNAFMLMLLCEEKQYDVPVFATFDRITALNFEKGKDGKPVRINGEDGTPRPFPYINFKNAAMERFDKINSSSLLVLVSSTSVLPMCLALSQPSSTASLPRRSVALLLTSGRVFQPSEVGSQLTNAQFSAVLLCGRNKMRNFAA